MSMRYEVHCCSPRNSNRSKTGDAILYWCGSVDYALMRIEEMKETLKYPKTFKVYDTECVMPERVRGNGSKYACVYSEKFDGAGGNNRAIGA